MLAVIAAVSWSALLSDTLWIFAWLVLVTAAELFPVLYLEEVNLTVSMPLLLAAGMTLGPLAAGIIGFVGSWDARLLRRQITWGRALFNRSQISVSSLFAAAVFHGLGGSISSWPSVMLPCVAALATDMGINVVLVCSAAVMMSEKRPIDVVKGVVLDSPLVFLATYAGLAPIALLVAGAASNYGIAGLAASVVPLLLARQVFSLLKGLSLANKEAREQDALIGELERRIARERKDERARVAMDLHDSALASLYQVHLMGEVVKRDLAYGQLFELETDVPHLKEATDDAMETLRAVIWGLRESPIAASGLKKTLDLLIDEFSTNSRALIHAELESIEADSSVQLIIYQVAREAIENAVRHSDALNIHIRLRMEEDGIRLLVRDDGTGFLPPRVDAKRQFGLGIMRSRVEGAGGVFHLSSEPGRGTQIVARLPRS
jgi:signal transduction histidine kinase